MKFVDTLNKDQVIYTALWSDDKVAEAAFKNATAALDALLKANTTGAMAIKAALATVVALTASYF